MTCSWRRCSLRRRSSGSGCRPGSISLCARNPSEPTVRWHHGVVAEATPHAAHCCPPSWLRPGPGRMSMIPAADPHRASSETEQDPGPRPVCSHLRAGPEQRMFGADVLVTERRRLRMTSWRLAVEAVKHAGALSLRGLIDLRGPRRVRRPSSTSTGSRWKQPITRRPRSRRDHRRMKRALSRLAPNGHPTRDDLRPDEPRAGRSRPLTTGERQV